MRNIVLLLLMSISILCPLAAQTSWTADNGNGTFTNPLFYDEFSDPDIIRVGEDFYMAGTTMHCMPGLVVLHSKDLVNWKFLSYAFNQLNMGDEFRLSNGKEAYGQGIWAPCIRYHKGKFYIFSNINGHGMQVFISDNPAGPWEHKNMGGNIYDLSVLFDDNDKIYAVYKYDEVKMIEIKPDFSGYVEGSERVIIPAGNAMGEGHHIYKIKGKYYIISADYSPMGRMQCARADKIEGPYETAAISVKETMGTERVHWTDNISLGSSVPEMGFKFKISKPSKDNMGCATLHQGGIVDLPNGDWWGVSMLDFRAVGRTTCLSPVTWEDGWPYFGLPGNLGRSPRTWVKPAVNAKVEPHAPYQRSDNFDGKALLPVWQWNHEPDHSKWSLTKGKLRLHTLPAKDFLWAKNTLTQRGIGPVSSATVTLDASRLKDGDIAGIGLLNIPYAWLGVSRMNKNLVIRWYDQAHNKWMEAASQPLASQPIFLRVTGNFDEDTAWFSYSVDGESFTNIGDSVLMPYQLKTFQGTRYALFAYNSEGKQGGYADFDNFQIDEPLADRSKNIPTGKIITLFNRGNDTRVFANPHGTLHFRGKGSKEYETEACRFRVHDRGQGRLALEAMNGTGFMTVVGAGLSADVRLTKEESEGSLFQWQDMLHGQCMLLSLKTNRYVGLDPATGEPYGADWTGASPSRENGTVFIWNDCQPKEDIVIHLQEKGAEVSPTMYGVFFEEINHAGDGGLYAELVQNRSFEELEMPEGYHAEGKTLYPKPVKNHITGEVRPERYRWTTSPVPAWSLQAKDSLAAQMQLTKYQPKFTTAPNNLELTIKDASEPVLLINEGYWGMNLVAEENYLLRVIARTTPEYKGHIAAKLLSEKNEELASAPITINTSGEWNDIKIKIKANGTAAKGKLALVFDAPGKIWLDYVSLFPENTFNQRNNGLRKDVAQMLVGLKPAFVRWPGGCVVEGISLENRFEWKKTLGDPAARPGEYSTWGYRCSYGFGYYEMLQFCEDINAKAMYVCNVGLGCQFRMGDACSEDKIDFYLNDCLDAIEYALGDKTTEWGARRTADGHPKPFPLQYVEIGNENWGDEYDKRFDIFYKTIKEKYPQLTLISNHGINGTGKIAQTDMVDPHWYVAPDFFYQNSTIFDQHPRGKYTVYVGEYACNRGVGGGNMTAALSEAAFISGMERNGDLVKMASYAPLFENRNDRSWSTNLIWIDSDQVLGRSSYYVQKMAAENRPTYNIKYNRSVSMDKNSNLTHSSDSIPLQFLSSGYDEETKEIIIKVVNAADVPYSTSFQLDGVTKVDKKGNIITLSATSGKDENSFDEPEKIYPRQIEYNEFNKHFSYEFLPFSYTIFRISAR